MNKNLTPPSALRTVYLDVMEKGKFICQLPYKYCPLFPVSIRKVEEYVKRTRPSLQGRNITIAFSNNRVINKNVIRKEVFKKVVS